MIHSGSVGVVRWKGALHATVPLVSIACANGGTRHWRKREREREYNSLVVVVAVHSSGDSATLVVVTRACATTQEQVNYTS